MTDRTVPTEPTWKTVPTEPTPEMLRAIKHHDWTSKSDVSWADGYKIMLAASPASPAAPGAEVEPVAWCAFAENGNVRLWDTEHARQVRASGYFLDMRPLYPSPPTIDAIRAQARREALEEAAKAAVPAAVPAEWMEDPNWPHILEGMRRSRELVRALADKGEAEGWRSLDDCPSDGQLVWVAGGRYSGDPEIQTADGDWWRSEAKRGSKAVPTVWMPLRVPAPPAEGSK